MLLQICAVIGLIIALIENLGIFKDPDRIALLTELKENLECNKDHSGAKKFIKDFVLKNPKLKKASQKEFNDTEKIIFTGLFRAPKEKRPVADILSGNIKLKNIHGETSLSLCSFEDLKNWAKETPFWKWLGWSMVAIGVVFSIILLIFEEIVKKQNI